MRTHAYRAAPLLALAFSLIPAVAHAAEAEADPTIIVTAPELTNEAEARVQKTAGGADVVSHQDYADKSIVSLRDTLAFSPGVYLQPRYGQEVRISLRGSGLSRGFHMRGLTLLQDGVPINLADDNGDFHAHFFYFFDFISVLLKASRINAEFFFAHEGLSTKLKQDAFVFHRLAVLPVMQAKPTMLLQRAP